jgi:DNA-directed RNA polymerase specialized sigma24 family protein
MSFAELLNKKYRIITENVCKNNELADDLHSEAILFIHEKKYEFTEIRNLSFFFAKVVWLTWHSNKFRQKYITPFQPLQENQDVEEQEQKEVIYNEIVNMLNDKYSDDFDYYEKNLLKMYVKLGDCRAVSRKTNIPYRTVANDIKTIKDNLKKAHNEENTD